MKVTEAGKVLVPEKIASYMEIAMSGDFTVKLANVQNFPTFR